MAEIYNLLLQKYWFFLEFSGQTFSLSSLLKPIQVNLYIIIRFLYLVILIIDISTRFSNIFSYSAFILLKNINNMKYKEFKAIQTLKINQINQTLL